MTTIQNSSYNNSQVKCSCPCGRTLKYVQLKCGAQDVKDTRYVWNAWEFVHSSLCFHCPHLLVGLLPNPHLLSLHYLSSSWRADRHWVKPSNDRLGFCFSAANIIASKLELFYGNKICDFFKMKFGFSHSWGPIWALLTRYRRRMFVSWELWWLIFIKKFNGRTVFLRITSGL